MERGLQSAATPEFPAHHNKSITTPRSEITAHGNLRSAWSLKFSDTLSRFLALCVLFHCRDMKGFTILGAGILASFLAISAAKAAVTTSFPALGAEHAVTHTNWVENTVTNLIEMRMSRNRFINEYRTNWVEHVTTNVSDVYRTNQLTRNFTNRFIVDGW